MLARAGYRVSVRWCSSTNKEGNPPVENTSLEHSKQVGEKGESQVAKKVYDKRFVYSTTSDEGDSQIMFKHNPPDDPRAHREGEILDFTDGAAHAFQRNPFGEVTAQAKAGEIEGVRPLSIGIPGNKTRSLYGFERNNKYSLTNYGQSSGYLADDNEALDPSFQLMFANERLPGFDETRESIYDKFALRKYTEQRDLRLLERDALLHERGLSQATDQILMGAADDMRRVRVRDAVMQSSYKWMGMKSDETEEAYIRQGEDVFFSERMLMCYTIVATCVVVTYAIIRSQEDGSLQQTAQFGAGELTAVSGYCGRSESYGSYTQVGQMHRYNDMIAKHVAKHDGHTRSVAELRASESFVNQQWREF